MRPFLVTAALSAAAGTVAGQEPRIVVGPDYLVSRDGDRPHVEVMAAANPRNPSNLLAGAITFTRPDGGAATKAYVSFDGGVQWEDIVFAEQKEMGGGDPQVAFTAAGTAIFATLATRADETGRTRAFLHAYRSEDGGRTWSAPFDLGASYDHPMLAADQSAGPFAGRLYMSVLYGREYNLGVFRSEDDGRSWIGPVKFLDGAGERGLNVDPLLVLHDGAIMVPFRDFPSTPEQAEGWTESRIWTVVSTDGGVTFSEPRPGPVKLTGEEVREAREGTPRFRGGSWTLLAVDSGERFRDRAYAVWPSYSEGLPRIVISWTDDRGSTWSDPRLVAPPESREVQQFQPAVAVNPDGVLGVSWYDTRHAPSRFAFHQYFAASFDGGESFTAPHRVSGALSEPLGSGNLVPAPITFSGPEGELRVALISAASRWVNGGDYMGLTASADGHFHPVWADARSGVYQVYTAMVRIEDEPPTPPPALGEPVDVTERIELVNDPGSYDAETGVAELWIRLRNVSATPIAGPVEVEIRKFGSGMGDVFSELAPEVLNADNGLSGNGAAFRYDEVLGSEGFLPPGGVSGAIRWRLKLAEPIRIPNLHLYITAREVGAPPPEGFARLRRAVPVWRPPPGGLAGVPAVASLGDDEGTEGLQTRQRALHVLRGVVEVR